MAELSVRYIVDDVAAALPFYQQLGFELRMHPAPGFAALERDGLRLLLNQPGAGGAGRDTADGRTPGPGGWNRLQLPTSDLDATVSDLGRAGIRFRGEIVVGNGGRQILAEDPSGNLVELFEPRRVHRTDREGGDLARSTPPAEDTERVARTFIQVWSAGNLDLMYRIRDGKVVDERGVVDVLGLMAQVGAQVLSQRPQTEGPS